jgi:hypothetical protein
MCFAFLWHVDMSVYECACLQCGFFLRRPFVCIPTLISLFSFLPWKAVVLFPFLFDGVSSRDRRASYVPCWYFAGVRISTIALRARKRFFFLDVLCQDSARPMTKDQRMTHDIYLWLRKRELPGHDMLRVLFNSLRLIFYYSYSQRKTKSLFSNDEEFNHQEVCKRACYVLKKFFEILREKASTNLLFALQSLNLTLFSASCSVDKRSGLG